MLMTMMAHEHEMSSAHGLDHDLDNDPDHNRDHSSSSLSSSNSNTNSNSSASSSLLSNNHDRLSSPPAQQSQQLKHDSSKIHYSSLVDSPLSSSSNLNLKLNDCQKNTPNYNGDDDDDDDDDDDEDDSDSSLSNRTSTSSANELNQIDNSNKQTTKNDNFNAGNVSNPTKSNPLQKQINTNSYSIMTNHPKIMNDEDSTSVRVAVRLVRFYSSIF